MARNSQCGKGIWDRKYHKTPHDMKSGLSAVLAGTPLSLVLSFRLPYNEAAHERSKMDEAEKYPHPDIRRSPCDKDRNT
jgi:hypothetical protein